MAYLLWHYVAKNAAIHATRPAVKSGATVLSYKDLDDQSTRVANVLAAAGVGRGHRVGLYMPKAANSVVAMLGIIKTGAAYVPIDPNAPSRRAAFILGDCAVTTLVTSSRKLKALTELLSEVTSLKSIILTEDESAPQVANSGGGVPILGWDEVMRDGVGEQPQSDAIENDPAYLLYTSGSTGNPKGVIISHRNAMACVEWAADAFEVEPNDRLSNHAPLHFDLSVLDIYVALRSGACVVMVPEKMNPFPVELASWIESEEITTWYSVPSALTRLLLHGDLGRFAYPKLRTVLYAGEVFPIKYLRDVMGCFPNARFFNLYGPTETNVCTYTAVPDPIDDGATDIPIGKACANTEVFAVRPDGAVAGPGEEGELHVRGPTVMLGYWGLSEKTAENLVADARQSAYSEPTYRTGDIVRMQDDGSYMFVGRKDHMVKSRGYRIELGEIEQVLYSHDRVKDAVVLALSDDEVGARLKAVVVSVPDEAVTASELTALCLKRLPRYMVPEEFFFREHMPRTSTGKADRVALLTEIKQATS